jgi:hypothetical protein
MNIILFKFHAHPEHIAVSKTGNFVPGHAFFLDFSRPLEVRRHFIITNSWLGPAIGILVPVVHECEEVGGYVIGVKCDDPLFAYIRQAWMDTYPAPPRVPSARVDGVTIVADFGGHFPEDC